jgi:hypothetical protein
MQTTLVTTSCCMHAGGITDANDERRPSERKPLAVTQCAQLVVKLGSAPVADAAAPQMT